MHRFYSRLLYAGLLVARILFSVLPSYIHPDEFFQSSEIAASDILKVTGHRTWEFSSQAPVRSIVPIYLYAGTPMFILSFFAVTPWTLFYGSRIFMALLSFGVDLSVYRVVGKRKWTMLLLASSYCLVLFHVHTFSNAFASVVLSVCFLLLKRVESGGGCFLLGVGLALGSFTHIAFPMFAWPLGLACLAALVSALRSGSLTTRGLVLRVAGLAAGGVFTALGLVVVDSLYYGSLRWNGAEFPYVSGSLTFTVLNNLSYNSQHDNLAAHGIQPRYLHALVNMPLLFGPLYILALVKLWVFLRSDKQGTGYVGMAAAGSVMSGVVLLSLAPHQEARFLLPALPGLAIGIGRWQYLASRYFWWMWITFNGALFIIFSMHQAGVVPVVVYLSESVWTHAQCRYTGTDALCRQGGVLGTELTTRVYLVSTYLAPRHLLAQPADRSMARARVDLVDLVGLETEEIRDILGGSVHVNATLVRSSQDELVFRRTTDTHYESQNNDAPDDGSTTDMQPGSTRRERNKQRAQRRRERETSVERAQRREIERLRAAARRHNETPEEREIRRLNGRMRAMRRRENETEDERQRRRELNRIRMAERRRTLKHAAGSEEEADDPAYLRMASAPDYADMQSTSAGARRECLGFTHPREFPFRVPPDSRVSEGLSERPSGTFPASCEPRADQDAMSQAFSSLNMAIQPDMSMLFQQGRLMNMPQSAVFTPPANNMNLGSQIPVFAHTNPMPFHLPRQPAAAPAAPIAKA
ncbi:hypothetical protein IWW39_001483 [Coemansia spiralis]|uniref:Mannosyltransferase n=1 Tax=Coemansia spiralis TaxID=417178 RepID=A0A9W8GMC2_9FUNG|nr:hypothetical protein IWW39_001483 [Coemansia spiralis]